MHSIHQSGKEVDFDTHKVCDHTSQKLHIRPCRLHSAIHTHRTLFHLNKNITDVLIFFHR